MKAVKLIVVAGLILLAGVLSDTEATAQSFGKNKVQYTQFGWRVASSTNFEVYFYAGQDSLASVVLDLAERAAVKLSNDLGHRLQKKVPIILYGSHYDFEQTNIIFDLIEEGVGGFTEIFKNRVVIPFTGSFEELRHVLVHELVHAYMFDMLYTGIFDSIISAQYLYQIPLWFMEGLAEYESLSWDDTADMIMRDAAISGYAVSLERLGGGYLVYKQGQSAVDFLVKRYGKEKLREIIRSLRVSKNLERGFERALGMNVENFSKAWMESVKKQYWPEVALRAPATKYGRRITDHTKDGSFMNVSPAVSPAGDKLVFLSDRAGYTDVILASAIDGKVLRRLVRGEKTMRFEVIPSFRSSLTWAPDGEMIAFVAKSGRGDVLYLVRVEDGRVLRQFKLDLSSAAYPNWSPDGRSIALTGLKHGMSDIYVVNVDTGDLKRLTSDVYDDIEPDWSPDGRLIAFASDRDVPFTLAVMPGSTGIGNYSIYTINIETEEVRRIAHTGGDDRNPCWSPDGTQLLFSSSPNGISNLFALDTRDSSLIQLTNVLGGAFSPQWSKSDRLAFSLFSDGGWDVYVAKPPLGMKAVMDELIEENQVWRFVPPREVTEIPEAEAEGAPPESRPVFDRADSAAVRFTLPVEMSFSDTLGIERDTLAAAMDSLIGTQVSASSAVANAKPYRVKFSPDWVTGGFQYTSAYGFGGSTEISLSDFLGNHRIYVASDFFSSVEETDILGIYYYLPRRLDLGVGAFHYKSYYYSQTTALGEEFSEEKYFSDRNYGFMLLASYPFGKFKRVDLDLTQMSVDRVFYEYDSLLGVFRPVSTRTRRVFSPGLTLVGDTVRWGMLGPVAGSRWAISYSAGLDLSSESMTFRTTWADLRKYFRVAPGYSFAFRLVGAMSEGADAQRFFAGGAYTLRGYEDFEFRGTRALFLNSEFRFPFIERLGLVWPIPLGINDVAGVLFFDVGGAWSDDELFRPFSREGGFHMDPEFGGAALGTGIRTGVAFIIVKVDFAWRTDFDEIAGYRTHVSFGGEF